MADTVTLTDADVDAIEEHAKAHLLSAKARGPVTTAGRLKIGEDGAEVRRLRAAHEKTEQLLALADRYIWSGEDDRKETYRAYWTARRGPS